MTFPSKRDAWFVVVIWTAAAACMIAAALLLWAGAGGMLDAVPAVLLAATAAFLLWVLYGTRYTFADGELDARCGPFRFRVPLGDVVSAEPTREPLSGPACSLDRLLIRYGSRRILVSPDDRRGFLDALVRHGAGLVRDGDRVVKKAAAPRSAV
ncbi:MAG TPA: PH domain-containing protein [Vicinamibacterales bacterium]